MKARYGKIAVGLLLMVVLAVSVFVAWPRYAKSATVASQVLVLPSSPTVTYDASTYILIWERSTGNFVDNNGAIAAGNTWANASIATAPHAQNTEVYTGTIPALDSSKEYVMSIWSGANDSNADTYQAGPFLYDPVNNITFSDTNPIRRKNVGVRTQ